MTQQTPIDPDEPQPSTATFPPGHVFESFDMPGPNHPTSN